jgi:hypothetical protein
VLSRGVIVVILPGRVPLQQQLVDARAVEVDDFDAPAVPGEFLAHVRMRPKCAITIPAAVWKSCSSSPGRRPPPTSSRSSSNASAPSRK